MSHKHESLLRSIFQVPQRYLWVVFSQFNSAPPIHESIWFSACCVKGVLLRLANGGADERPPVFFNEFGKQFIDRQFGAIGVVIASANHLATEQPDIVPMTNQGLAGQTLGNKAKQNELS